MLVILSPAKKLDWTARPDATTRPDFQADAVALADVAKDLGAPGLKKLMHISDKLADLNLERFENFAADPEPEATRPAIHAFAGDTYTGLDARSLDADALDWAKGHLRILSGLYGLLRPFDAMQPYRLEMGSRLATERGKSLYDYWGDRISMALNDAAKDAGAEVIVNCASQEYFGAVDLGALRPRVITPQFLDSKDGAEPKVISFYAKKARGAMARFILERRLTDPAELREFDTGGYAYDPEQSTPDRPVFLREI
ncbi:peroxide stress protein YaaA [Roseibaca sp. Y0-43]|uniref:peroxide stress protein YaaA n=1 Tax=Roseibaca sp. Y0-43 TaxID=2816854 RepID=UPI001D0C38C7|nr:peroxide stress protein YaaA [Roseibaca sp. Y0-43]MCC1481911.1 peroxide stress protein YaaA [Roseibaca sp. Y0-43]